jgi:hypothetical protein
MIDVRTENAATIYQTHLDQVSDLLWARRLKELSEFMAYPHQMRCKDGRQMIVSPGDLIAVARQACASLERVGATAYHRICCEADFALDDPDRIDGRHMVFVLNGAEYAIAPYEAEMTLRRFDGVWLGTGIVSHVRLATFTILDPDALDPYPAPAFRVPDRPLSRRA